MKFIFRGLVVLEYNPETKQTEAPNKYVEWGQEYNDGPANFNKCNFVPEDYVHLADFFNAAYAHATGVPNVDLTDIEVY
jgi:hypothetical protein